MNGEDIDITDSACGPVGDGCRSDKPETEVQSLPGRPVIEYESLSSVAISGRGMLFVIKLDRECENFDFLLNERVKLDGVLKRVTAVERSAHVPPWRKGEKVGLLVSYAG